MSIFASEDRAKAPPPISRRLRLESMGDTEPRTEPRTEPSGSRAELPVEEDNDTVRLLKKLRREVKDLKYKQTEMMQNMGESDKVLRHINERGQNPSDEDLRGLNLEEVVEKLHVCCSTSMEIMCFSRSTVYARD